MQQKGLVNIYTITALFIISSIAAFYLGTKIQKPNTEVINKPQQASTSPSPSPIHTLSPKLQLQSSKQPSNTNSNTNSSGQFDYATYFTGLFPKDIPVYPGAKMNDYDHYGAMNQGPCMEELLKENPKCLQVVFTFTKDDKDASLEQIVNWYVTNTVPGWTYRGVAGSDQRTNQFGDIYNKSIYYRMQFASNVGPITIFYNGPYPISNLYPKP